MNNINKNIIFISGGGTGGHLFPAITIGKGLEEMGLRIIYIGSKFGIEKKYYSENNIKAKLLDIKGIQRNISIKSFIQNIYFPIRFIKSYFESIKLIKKYNPLVIVGTGGYSSGMPLLAGIRMNIPTVIQEQNSIPGLVTKTLYKKVDFTFVAYDYTKKTLKRKNVILAGNPIRKNLVLTEKIISKQELGIEPKQKVIFILGGSQGSQSFNNHILENIDFYSKNNYHIYLQCGVNNYSKLYNKFNKYDNVTLKKFIKNISIVYSASDIVISRAGALAISELCFMGKAMILIPYKYAANNHQKINAEEIQNRKACILIDEDNLKKGELENNVINLFSNEEQIAQLEKNSRHIAYKHSTKNITEKIKEIANG